MLIQRPFALSPGPPSKRMKHTLSTKMSTGKEFMEKVDINIERVWNPTEILIFEILVQLLSSLQIPVTADNIKRYFNRLAKRIIQLGFAFEIVEKSLKACILWA